MAQYGNFGNVSPDDMAAIRDALNRRGMGDQSAALNQQSAASPTPAPPPPPEVAGGPEMPGTMTASGQTTGQLPMETGNEEAKLIIKALSDRLKALSGGM